MKKTRILTAMTLTATLAATVVYLLKQCRHKKRLAVVSDAGYETAHDIHFPLKYKK